MRSLRQLVDSRRGLVSDRVRLTNRITAALKAYFPQVLDWFRDKEAAVFADFLERWPTLPAAQRARPETLTDFFRAHNVRSQSAIDRRVDAVRAEQALTRDVAVIAPAKLLVETLLPQLRAACAAIERFDADIARYAPSCPTTSFSARCPAQGLRSRRGCWWPLVSDASASPTPLRSRSTRASPRSPNAAATSPGSTGAGHARRFCVSLSSSGWDHRPPLLLGAGLLQELSHPRHEAPERLCGRSPSSGSASCTAAGPTAFPMTSPATCWLSRSAKRRFSSLLSTPPPEHHFLFAVRLRA
jgi:hypothetical protein